MQSRSLVFACLVLFVTSAAFGQWVLRPTGTTENLNGVSARGLQGATAVGNNATILYTEDDGFDWGPQAGEPGINYFAVSFAQHDTGIVAGDAGTILFTFSGGQGWDTKETGWMHPYYAAHQANGLIGVVAGVNSVFQPIVGISSDGWQTHDFHVFYPQHDSSSQEGTIRGIYFQNAMTGFAAVTIFDGHGAICRTIDGGTTWETVYWGDNALYAIEFANVDVGCAVGGNGAIVRTQDGGATWSDRESPTNENLTGVSFGSFLDVWAVGAGGMILHSMTGGADNWVTQESPVAVNLNAISMLNADTGYVAGDNGVVLYTNNGGGESNPNQPPGEFVRVAPEDSSWVRTDNNPMPVDLIWTQSADPDGDAVVYLLHVWSSNSTYWGDSSFVSWSPDTVLLFPIPWSMPWEYTVYWSVSATDGQDTVEAQNGQGMFHIWLEVSADDQPSLPREFSLSAYPNPFNPTTTLNLSLPVSSEAVLRVFDVTGRVVRETRLGRLETGLHEIAFDGSALPSGLYFAAFETPTSRLTQKLVLMK